VVLAFVELAQSGVEIAAQRLDQQVGAQRAKLHHTTQARGAHARALRQIGERGEIVGHERIAGVFPLHDRCELEARGQIHGHVLERVHRELCAAFFEGGFKLFHEQTLAADLGQRAVKNLVASRGHAEQFNMKAEAALQQVANMFGLPQRESAFAGGDDDV
jgi:hypothetical protein